MASRETQEAVKEYDQYIRDHGVDEKILEYYMMAVDTAFLHEQDEEYGLILSNSVKKHINAYCLDKMGVDVWEAEKFSFDRNEKYMPVEMYYHAIYHEAKNKKVDSYFLYLERDRLPKDRFYSPKRRHFLKFGIIRAFQGLLDDKFDIVCISLPPGTAKTTALKFFHSGVIGWFPADYSLFYSHSSDITRMYFDGVLQIVTDRQEYRWGDIFPELKITGTNAKAQQFNVGSYKAFPSLQCTSVGSESAGKVRASKFLLVDDMIGKLEEALNKSTLEKLWGAYSVDARQRKTVASDGKPCKEIHCATRWSTVDIIGRLQKLYEGNERFNAIAVPDIDKETGQSNFDYDYGGFTVDYFNDIALTMDDISYRCLYKQEPIEREGLLYHDDELRRFNSLPVNADGTQKEPDAILGVCDTKTTGTDYMVMPVIYQYDSDYYCVDCVCNNSTNIDVLETKMANMIAEHKMQMLEVESNAGGAVIASNIQKKVSELGWNCNITTKATETNKQTRIIVNADWVKKNILFKDHGDYDVRGDYGELINQLLSYSIAGKNVHDDVPDCLANFALFVNRKFKRREVTIIRGGLL